MKRLFASFALLVLGLAAYAQSQQIRAFSHRGGRMERDENTLMAFQESWDAGYTGFETDVRMSKDGVLFICHDHTLERTTNGQGILEEKTAAELKKLKTKKGNPILMFDDLIKFLDGKDNLYVEFELKSSPANLYPQERLEEYVEKVYQGVQKIHTNNSDLLFTSSDYRGLRYLQEHHPEAKLLLIVSKPINDETITLAKTTGIMTLGCTMSGTSREMVKKAHDAGITVSLWPGQSVEDFMYGAYVGADYMCTDIPLTIKDWVSKNAPWLNVRY